MLLSDVYTMRRLRSSNSIFDTYTECLCFFCVCVFIHSYAYMCMGRSIYVHLKIYKTTHYNRLLMRDDGAMSVVELIKCALCVRVCTYSRTGIYNYANILSHDRKHSHTRVIIQLIPTQRIYTKHKRLCNSAEVVVRAKIVLEIRVHIRMCA